MTEPRHQTPAPMYSEDPEPVYSTPIAHPTPIHAMQTGGPVSPTSEANAYQSQGQSESHSIPDALHGPTPINGHSEKQYPHQPDSIGQAPDYDAVTGHEKAYAGQPLPQQGPPQPNQYYTPYGHPSGYATAVPLHGVQSAPCPVDCPVCGEREMTRINPISGGTTHGWAAILCFCCCLGCIPYLMSSLKDVEHSCGKCNAKLAVWHNSGRVQVLQNSNRK
ncbi:LPS-induced tumor necrosis factor alpha factor [Penicillium antarcticum]|uniref:LPS-induced tumor necrosis factor alpha factor n=1 Tax=Penicillium antarcticum TaxID=416450 RepID=UPI0023995FCB|nr:LPS-induced tumor necrosis factor alpha factor [Penicillium antarcticum]KAJ5312808.1 LPS-induced tumor necrosis factor alpha factor [Penicillium antarcticum]